MYTNKIMQYFLGEKAAHPPVINSELNLTGLFYDVWMWLARITHSVIVYLSRKVTFNCQTYQVIQCKVDIYLFALFFDICSDFSLFEIRSILSAEWPIRPR